jgi:hypothetical protein
MHLPDASGGDNRGVQMLSVKPGDYTLGSPESRAAARAALERRLAERNRGGFTLITNIPRPSGDGIRIGDWCEGNDGTLIRFCTLPTGMTMEEAERVAAERRYSPLLKIAH